MFDANNEKVSRQIFIFLALMMLFQSFVILLLSWGTIVTYLQPWRQSQTALTTYWFLKEGISIKYETPVFGAPWEIPFEFPLYQILVAKLASYSVPLDFAGRVISYVFLIACLWPIWMLRRILSLDKAWFFSVVAMFLASPLYLFWGRSFMIETTALFFAMAHAAFFMRFIQNSGLANLALAVLFGILGVLTKGTTLPAFSLLAGFGFLWVTWEMHRSDVLGKHIGRLIIGAVVLLLPYPIGLAWVDYTDVVKTLNPIGISFRSEELKGWNYGSFDMLLTPYFWFYTLPGRMLSDTLGRLIIIITFVVIVMWFFPKTKRFFPAAALNLSRRAKILVALLITCFWVPLLIFTNLHIVHDYYQVCISIFVILAISIVAHDARARGKIKFSTYLVCLVVLSQVLTFYSEYFKGVLYPPEDKTYQIAFDIREHLPEDSVFVGFGAGWSSIAPYYAQRRALMITDGVTPALLEKLLSDPQKTFGGKPLGGVMHCKRPNISYQHIIDRLTSDMVLVAERGDCALYVPTGL